MTTYRLETAEAIEAYVRSRSWRILSRQGDGLPIFEFGGSALVPIAVEETGVEAIRSLLRSYEASLETEGRTTALLRAVEELSHLESAAALRLVTYGLDANEPQPPYIFFYVDPVHRMVAFHGGGVS